MQHQRYFFQKGFTLIELVVVVVIIGIISGILVPHLLSRLDRKRKADMTRQETASQEEQVSEKDREDVVFQVPPGAPPVIESAKLTMSLLSTYQRVGLDVYTRYEAQCTGRLVFRRAANTENPVLLTIPLPEGRAEARDVRLTLTRLSDSTTWEPDNLVYHGQCFYWSGTIPDGERLIADINFVALGREQFAYRLPPAQQLKSLEILVEFSGLEAPHIPDHALQPTEISEQQLTWKFSHVVTDRMIILEIPGALSPLGRVLLLVRLVAVAVLLFGIGFWYLGEQVQPGHLKNFRWGHFLLLALTYSLYFVIFVVISFHGNMPPWIAMGISALFSLPLLLFHVTRVLSFRFASRYVLPLAVFTLGLVINGVYGGVVRDYLFIAAVIAVIAYLTLTYEKWDKGRADYRKQQRKKYAQRIEEIRTKLTVAVKQILDDIQVADMETERLVDISQQTELDSERFALTQKRQPVSELLKEYKELTKHLAELRVPSDVFSLEWYESFEQKIDQFGREAIRVLEVLRAALAELKNKKAALRQQRDEQNVFCVACGRAAPSSPYCKECGTPRVQELICRECGERLLLPLHLLAGDIALLQLYCPHCGEQYTPVGI